MKENSQQLASLTRRGFLVGSALLLGASALEGLDVHTLPVKNTATPRGKIRNLLTHQCSPEELKQSLIPMEEYKPYPQIGDPAWSRIHPGTAVALLAEGERFFHYKYEAPSATLFLEYCALASAPATSKCALLTWSLCVRSPSRSASKTRVVLSTT